MKKSTLFVRAVHMSRMAGVLAAWVAEVCLFANGPVMAQEAQPALPVLPLQAPQAPFLREKPATLQRFTPVLEGNAIVSGNKRLEVEPVGTLRLLADGQAVLGNMSAMLAIVDKQTGAKDWWRVDDPKRCKADLCSFKAEARRFQWTRVLALSNVTAEYTQSLTLQDDGLIRLETAWRIPDDARYTATPSSMMAAVPVKLAQGQRLQLDAASLTIPPQPAYDFLAAAASVIPQRIELMPGTPAGVALLPQTMGSVRFYMERAGATSFVLRLYETPRERRLAVLLDIRQGTGATASEQTQAGIDFMAVEHLTLPDRRATRNLLVNPSFEQGRIGYWRDWGLLKFSTPAVWDIEAYVLDSQQPNSGRFSMRLPAPARKEGDYRSIGHPLRTLSAPLAAGRYTFSLYARGGGEGQRLSVWFPNACWVGYGNKHLPIGFKPNSKDPTAQQVFALSRQWQRYQLTFQVPQSMPVFASIAADSPAADGEVWIDDLQLQTGAEATAYETAPVQGQLLTASPDNFLTPQQRPDARLQLTAAPAASGRVAVSIRNFFAEEVFTTETGFTCDSQGRAAVELPLEGKLGRGIFTVRCDYTLADGRACYQTHRLAIMDSLNNDFRLKNMFSEDYGGTMLGRFDVRKLLERYRKIGIGATCHNYVRAKPAWELLRAYGVEPFDSPMGSITRSFVGGDYFSGQKVLQLEIVDADTNTRLVVPTPAEHLSGDEAVAEAYLEKIRSAAATVAAGHDWILVWTLSGEIFHHWPYAWWAKEGTQEKAIANCGRILAAFAEGVKRGNPRARVYQGTPTNLGVAAGIREIDETLRAVSSVSSTRFDLIGCHTYRPRPENPDLDADTQTLLDVMARCGYDKAPVFFGEGMHFGPYTIPQWGIESASWLPPACWYYGPLSYDMGWSEKISAAWRARCWLIALKYQDRILTSMSGAFINNFEMDLDLTPYATQKISNTLGRLLGDAAFRRDIRFAPYTRCYVFEDAQRRPVAAVWGFHPKLDAGTMQPPQATANFGGTLEQVFDLMEQERTPQKVGAATSFPVSSFPLFLRGKPGTLATFAKALEDCSLEGGSDLMPLMVSAKPKAPQALSVTCRNFLSKPFAGELQCAGKGLALAVPAAGTQDLQLDVLHPLTSKAVTDNPLAYVIRSGAADFQGDLSFRGLLARKARHEMTLDGDLSDWQDVPEVAFTELVNYDKANSDEVNHSGWFKVAWTEKGLYIAARVRDNSLVAEQQTPPEQRWNNDSLQVYVDSFCDARTRQQTGYDENDYEYTVYPNAAHSAAEVFRRRTPDPQLGLAVNAPRDGTIASDIPAGFRKLADGYAYELFFPAKYLLPVRLEKGYVMGFGLTSNDRDTGAKSVRGCMTLTPAGSKTGCFNQPHLWPAVLLWDEEP